MPKRKEHFASSRVVTYLRFCLVIFKILIASSSMPFSSIGTTVSFLLFFFFYLFSIFRIFFPYVFTIFHLPSINFKNFN